MNISFNLLKMFFLTMRLCICYNLISVILFVIFLLYSAIFFLTVLISIASSVSMIEVVIESLKIKDDIDLLTTCYIFIIFRTFRQ